ncbi:MAG: putative Diguanylate cyclase [Burkholderiaceae bacterium]|nr:putative Diguanylate cyclase [Burkholderiaceae bacterium]
MERITAQFLDIIEHIGVIMLLVDPDSGTIVDSNLAAAAFYGYPRAQLIGMPMSRINASPPEILTKEMQRALSRECNIFNFSHRLVSGQMREVEVHSHPIDLQGKRLLFSIVHDITEHKRNYEALQLQSSITANAAEGILLIKAEDGVIVYTNHRFDEMFGYAPGELVGQHVSVVNAPSSISPKETAQRIFGALQTEGVWRGEIYNRRKDGRAFWSYAHLSAFHSPDLGTLWVSYQSDITARKQAERRLRDQANLLELAHDGIIVRNLDSCITYWNRGAEELYGWPRAEALGKVTHELLQTGFPAPLADIKAELERSGRWEGELTHSRKDGSQIIVASRWQMQADDGMPGIVMEINNDITERKRLEHELERQAHTDYLTGATNRRHFMEIAELELARAVRYGNLLTILMLDIDYFKQVNDTYGHRMGDAVLVQLTEICRQILRKVDIFARYGGEEFVILLPQTGMAAAMKTAERLRVAVESARIPMERGLPLHFTVSVGVASLERKDDNLDVLLSQADRALYAAKHAGRNTIRSSLQPQAGNTPPL